MSSIGGFDPVSHASGIGSSQNATSSENEAKQMQYILHLLCDVAIFTDHNNVAQDAYSMQNTFVSEMEQHPVPIAKMEGQLNGIIKELNDKKNLTTPFPMWSCKEDQTSPGHSFMGCMLSFAHFFAQGHDLKWHKPDIHTWVEKLENYMKQGPWNAKSVENEANQFLSAVNSLTIDDPAGNPFPKQPSVGNIFGN